MEQWDDGVQQNWTCSKQCRAGEVRGRRFVSGLQGEQFALPVAVESLHANRRVPMTGERVVIAAADPPGFEKHEACGSRLGNSPLLEDGSRGHLYQLFAPRNSITRKPGLSDRSSPSLFLGGKADSLGLHVQELELPRRGNGLAQDHHAFGPELAGLLAHLRHGLLIYRLGPQGEILLTHPYLDHADNIARACRLGVQEFELAAFLPRGQRRSSAFDSAVRADDELR